MGAHPFDADGAAAGTDIPEKLSRHRSERRQRDRPDLALGELAVVLEQLVGKPPGARHQRRAVVGHAFDCQRVQVRDRVVHPIRVRGRRVQPLLRAAKVRKHRQPAPTVAASAQHPRHLTGGAGVGAQRQQPDTGLDEGMQQRQWPPVQAHGLHPLRRPAEPRAGQAERRRCGDDPYLVGPESLGEDGADAVAGRVSGGEHTDGVAAAVKPFEGLVQGAERLRPGDALLSSRPQQVEMTLPSDHHSGLFDHGPDRGRQPVRAIVTHAHHCEPGDHRTTEPGATAAVATQSSQTVGDAPLGARASRSLERPWACGGLSISGLRPGRAGRPRSREPAPQLRSHPAGWRRNRSGTTSTMTNRCFIEPVDRKERSPQPPPSRSLPGGRAG